MASSYAFSDISIARFARNRPTCSDVETSRTADARDRVAAIDPVGGIYRVGVLQLIGFPRHGLNQEGRAIRVEDPHEPKSGDLIGRGLRGTESSNTVPHWSRALTPVVP